MRDRMSHCRGAATSHISPRARAAAELLAMPLVLRPLTFRVILCACMNACCTMLASCMSVIHAPRCSAPTEENDIERRDDEPGAEEEPPPPPPEREDMRVRRVCRERRSQSEVDSASDGK
jgi:hypothetical protein